MSPASPDCCCCCCSPYPAVPSDLPTTVECSSASTPAQLAEAQWLRPRCSSCSWPCMWQGGCLLGVAARLIAAGVVPLPPDLGSCSCQWLPPRQAVTIPSKVSWSPLETPHIAIRGLCRTILPESKSPLCCAAAAMLLSMLLLPNIWSHCASSSSCAGPAAQSRRQNLQWHCVSWETCCCFHS